MMIKCFLLVPVYPEDSDRFDVPWRRTDTGEAMLRRDAPPGAIWELDWDTDRINGNGPCLVVVLPDGRHWHPGAQAANCANPNVDHDCWCVHGDPPDLTVDKKPVPGRSTCSAGAGSIGPNKPGGWHGFLHRGYLAHTREEVDRALG